MWQHWGPTSTRMIHDDADDSDNHDEDGEELVAAARLAALAGPVQRKERKGLDLSQWRELVPSKDSSNGKRIRESYHAGDQLKTNDGEDINTAGRRTAKQVSAPFKPVSDSSKSMSSDLGSAIGRSVANREFSWDEATTPGTDTSFRRDSEPMFIQNQVGEDRIEVDDAGNIQSNLSLEDQIDVENQARLQGMSPDEIAEAQAEIIGKMNPALVEVLKRRGIEKLNKKKKKDVLDASVASSGKLGSPPIDTQSNAEVSPNFASDDSHLVTTTSSKGNNSTQGIIPAENKGPSGSSLWNAWSDRVESVRNLRFSLDGDVVESGSSLVLETSKLQFLLNPFM